MDKDDACALVAVCRHRPFNFGHVGWGYRHHDGAWQVGAVEGVRWQRGNPNGFWHMRVDSLQHALSTFNVMRTQGAEYDTVKLLRPREDVTANPDFADAVAAWVHVQPYRVINRNCMDSTYDILSAFAPGYRGTGLGILPKPEDRWLPNGWYDHLPSVEEITLSSLELPVPIKAAVLMAAAVSSGPALPEAVTPPWRVPGVAGFIPPRNGLTEQEAAESVNPVLR